MADIKLRNISKKYNNSDKFVVEDINIESKNEEFLVLVGPSGCGKSTILRMVAGLIEITDGEIYIENSCVNDLEPKDRDIAMVFQSYALYPHLTVFQNIAYPLKQRKYSKEEQRKKVEETATLLNLTHLLDRKPKHLSGGERQRTALARAMVRKPKLFLMDEPLSNLDAQLRTQTRSEILKLHKRLKTTFIYVTHDQVEAMTMGDRIVVMNKGKIQQIATPYEIYNSPKNIFVAKFIGSPTINLIKASLEFEMDKFSIILEIEGKSVKLMLTEEYNKKLMLIGVQPRNIILGIRPENIHLSKSNDNTLELNITQRELMGADLFLYGDIAENTIVFKTIMDSKYNEIKNVKVEFDPKHVLLFDPDTGENLLKKED